VTGEVPNRSREGGAMRCPWCSKPLPAKRGRGSPRRFCSNACRQNCHATARRWAIAELEAGRVLVASLKQYAQKSVHAFSRGHLGSTDTSVASRVLPRSTEQANVLKGSGP
jgi:hypothetical protein